MVAGLGARAAGWYLAMRRDRWWVIMGVDGWCCEVVRGVDVSAPNAARMYDYWLGGCFL